jgi:archaellum component FlaG (FlaF/FlaG flagellin family)
MARVVAFIPDLLFGSSVVGALTAAGHEPVLASNEDVLQSAVTDADALIVDLTFDVPNRIELVRSVRPEGLKTLAFYSHVEAEVRDQARQAGFDMVIPRSRMAREGTAVLDRLLKGDARTAP